MALITFTGYPSSGKSRRAAQLKGALESRLQDPTYAGPQLKVVVISDDTLNISRDSYRGEVIHMIFIFCAYSLVDSRSEKPARAALFTAMQRHLGQDTILIVDGMNYIKGFRYQMYCAAREMKIRVCTVSGKSAVSHLESSSYTESRYSLSRPKSYAKNGTRHARMIAYIPKKRQYPTISRDDGRCMRLAG